MSWTKLLEVTRMNKTYLSTYLKRLTYLGLVCKGAKNREYKLGELGGDTIFLNYISSFIQEEIQESVLKGREKSGILNNLYSWIAFTDHPKIKEQLLPKEGTIERQIDKHIRAASKILNDFWESFVLSNNTSEDQRKIRTYRRYLLQILKLVHKNLYERNHKNNSEEVLEIYRKIVVQTRDRLSKVYPSLFLQNNKQARELLIGLEAAKEFRELKIRNEKHFDDFFQPDDLEGLVQNFALMEKWNEFRKEEDFSDEEIVQLEKMFKFVTVPKNRKVFEGYNRRLINQETILLCTSGGFVHYQHQVMKVLEKTPKKLLEELNA